MESITKISQSTEQMQFCTVYVLMIEEKSSWNSMQINANKSTAEIFVHTNALYFFLIIIRTYYNNIFIAERLFYFRAIIAFYWILTPNFT